MRYASLVATLAWPLALTGFFFAPKPDPGPSRSFDSAPASTYVWDCHVDPGITAVLTQQLRR